MADAPSAPYLPLDDGRALELDAAVFGAPFNASLVHEVVRAELNARRQGTASTKTRGQVSGGSAKPWRQKGTGRARAGSTRAPRFVGGGIVFGPTPRHYTVKVNRKARRAALRSVLSLHAGRGSLGLIDLGELTGPSTRHAARVLAGWEQPRPVLVVGDPERELLILKSFRNLDRVDVAAPDGVGVADLMRAAALVLSPYALERLTALAAAPWSGRRQLARDELAAVAEATDGHDPELGGEAVTRTPGGARLLATTPPEVV